MTVQERHNDELNRKRIEETSKGVLGYFVNRRRVVLLVVSIILISGLFAAFSLPREANPEVQVPVAVITTVWPGASPADIEELVTNEIESEVENLEKVKQITSSSSNSISNVTVEFEADADLEESVRKTRDAVDRVRDLPQDAEDPIVTEVRLDDIPIVTFSLVGDLTDLELKRLAETVQDKLEGISGVSRVQITGVRSREIEVALNPGELNRLRISSNDVIRAITQANLNLPLGDISSNGFIYNLRTIGEIAEPKDLEKIVVANTESGAVLLGDIAKVSDQLAEKTTISKIAIKHQNDNGNLEAQNTVSMQIYKTTGGNIINIVDSAKAELEVLKKEKVIPEGVEVVVTNDNSEFVRTDFNTLGNSGLQTLLLIFVVLTIALSLRFAVIALFSIPLIFLMGLGIINLQGSTLNSLTLFSLVLSLGLLIDTTIIILEGIYEALQKGYGARESALYSISIYKWPIVSGVLTTIAAFVPMFLVSGIVGQFLVTLPLTISAVLGSSLFVGLVIMPPLAAQLMKGASEKESPEQNWFQRKIINPLGSRYHAQVRKLLGEKKARRKMYFWISGLFVACIILIASGALKTELFPEVDTDFILINIELPQGTVLETTEKKVTEVEALVAEIPELKNYVANIGSSTDFGLGSGGSSASHLASITVNLVDGDERDLKSYEIAHALRPIVKKVKDATVTIEEIQGGPPTGSPIELQILGDDFIELSQTASDIKHILGEIEGVIDISSSDKPSPPEFAFTLDHERLGQFNLSAVQVSGILRAAIFGTEVSELTLDDEDVEVIVNYGSGIKTIDDIKNLEITNPQGQNIKVSQIADVTLEPALQTIRHNDLKRVVTVSAINESRSVREITLELDERLAEYTAPDGVTIKQGGEFEDEAQAFVDLYKAMIVAVLLIFFIMVLQFDSYKQPFVILLALPLAFIGAIFGTFILGLPLGFATFLGVVALAGIVVNDAIVLIARINDNLQNRKMSYDEAIAEAGEARLQPIILTTVTTVLGVTPLAFADEFWRGLSVAIAFGMVFATFLTLYVIPVIYQRVEKKKWLREHAKEKPLT